MNEDLKAALAEYTLALGDDELILGHRNSEWTGHAPILEEDIALTNIALDEIGHAVLWYELHSELVGEDPRSYPDRLVFFRPATEFRNARLVELPTGDWAFSILRQYLIDISEYVRLTDLVERPDESLQGVSRKISREEVYHRRHTRAWVGRLGLGTDESQSRMQNALDEMWDYALELFVPLPGEELLVEAGLVPASKDVRAEWERQVVPSLEDSGLTVPSEPGRTLRGREQHGEHLMELLSEMQHVARAFPEVDW